MGNTNSIEIESAYQRPQVSTAKEARICTLHTCTRPALTRAGFAQIPFDPYLRVTGNDFHELRTRTKFIAKVGSKATGREAVEGPVEANQAQWSHTICPSPPGKEEEEIIKSSRRTDGAPYMPGRRRFFDGTEQVARDTAGDAKVEDRAGRPDQIPFPRIVDRIAAYLTSPL